MCVRARVCVCVDMCLFGVCVCICMFVCDFVGRSVGGGNVCVCICMCVSICVPVCICVLVWWPHAGLARILSICPLCRKSRADQSIASIEPRVG